MNKFMSLLLLLGLITSEAFSQTTVKLSEVTQASVNFIAKNNKFQDYQIIDLQTPVALKGGGNQTYAFVVELEPQGFIVFSSLKEQKAVIAFSNEGKFDFNYSPNNTLLHMISGDMGCQQDDIINNTSLGKTDPYEKNKSAWDKLITGKTSLGKMSTTNVEYGPLLTDTWGGVNCVDNDSITVYTGNYFTPWHYSPGCVATSMSQVLNYWEWPKTGVGSHSYTDSYGSSQKTYSVTFSSSTYDYANMLDEYMGVASNDTQQRAIGKLAYDCGVALEMDYESSGSTSNNTLMPDALDDYFRSSGHHEYSSWSYFWTRMQENIIAGIPVPVAVYATNGAGHAPVIDGYKVEDDVEYYHLNMGWWGTCNAWYTIPTGFNSCGYTSVTAGVFDILPDPEISEIVRSSSEKDFVLKWNVSDQLNWDSFSIEESVDDGSWIEIASTVTATEFSISVDNSGTYNYRVRAKINGAYYYNSYSEEMSVLVKDDIVALEFDGNDSFYVSDNTSNNLDISSEYTIETWFNLTSHTSGTYPVLLDRNTVFSLYVISDDNSDSEYALRFVARNSSGSIIASLRTDESSSELSFGDWHHVAISRKNSVAKIYIDGNLIQSSTDSDFDLSSSSNALNVGARYWTSYERYLDGKLDGISISNTGKYSSNFSPNILNDFTVDANTIIALNLDAGTGTSLTDASGNFSNISLRSSPYIANWVFESYSVPLGKSLAIESFKNGGQVYIYPTLVRNNLSIKSNFDDVTDFNYSIYNTVGQVVLNGNTFVSKGEVRDISFESISNGVYIVKLNSNNYSLTERIIVKH